MTSIDESLMDMERRFGGVNRLHGPNSLACLSQRVSVAVVGLGGVGSWAVEALARSGVGHLHLIEMDHVSESNLNRQIQATYQTLGSHKAEALIYRVTSYYPECQLSVVDDLITAENSVDILGAWFERSAAANQSCLLLDCCDDARAKVAMVQWAKRAKVKLAVAGSAGGKRKPWLLRPADLRDTTCDPLLAKVRYQLRKAGTISRTDKAKVTAFYSDEPLSGNRTGGGSALNCAGYGSSVAVTATMGMQMAAWAVDELLQTSA